MPDASHPVSSAPELWADAFAALPLEGPPADPWANVSRELEARRRKRRQAPAWLGIAAAAALVAVVSWPRADDPAPAMLPVGATQVAKAKSPPPSPVGATQVATASTPPQPTPHVGATQVAPETTHRVAARAAPTKQIAEPPTDPLRNLQTESARLEALLAYARDERVGNASALLLADAFNDQVASIDAALADPTLDEARRESLWQARVDALQQAAGFVGTQRLLAAHGRSDALLVSVD